MLAGTDIEDPFIEHEYERRKSKGFAFLSRPLSGRLTCSRYRRREGAFA